MFDGRRCEGEMRVGEFLSLPVFDGYTVYECFNLEQAEKRLTRPMPVDDYRKVRNRLEDFDRIIVAAKEKELTILVHNR